MSEPLRKKKVKTSFFAPAGADELPKMAPAPVQLQLVPALEVADAGDAGDALDAVSPEPDVVHPPDAGEFVATSTAVVVEPEANDNGLKVSNEIQVYQGSLYLWVILALLVVNLATQAVKLVGKYPLLEKAPPFRLPLIGWTIGGWSEKGFRWFLIMVPFVFSVPVTLFFAPSALDALGYPGRFTPLQSLMFAPGLAMAALGVWSMLPKKFRRWLNREELPGSSLASDSDVAMIVSVLDKLEDTGLRERLRSVTREHRAVSEDEPDEEPDTIPMEP